MEIINGAKYTHVKGGEYIVIGMAKIKDPVSRNWIRGVLYVGDKFPIPEDAQIYARTEVDFHQRFTKVRDPDDSEGT